ncbi:DUF4129 domain-containing protein [Hymenobacter taeanensis]|uniref:DUF4129 domain-containing protein n=1 Tax=Hymenobacter taeanensis TaxID=2735321 RepID=A0A6M6BCT7_9BACT|nr:MULTISPECIES: DUF4129 domain-containing protein [Hymenobacter]QJX45740.1 DUF4129 domain-containing protein [Hymenobacter taeanensis]UOQ79580.1 DUF4129 domain-containing protein [Hymenobacter sp. 5414T-23]
MLPSSFLFSLSLLRKCSLRVGPGLLLCLLLAAHAGTASVPSAQPSQRLPKSPILPIENLQRDTVAGRQGLISLPVDQQAPVTLRRPPEKRLQDLRSQRAFQYEKPDEEPKDPSMWSLIWWRLSEWFRKLFSGPGYENGGRYAVYALFGAAFLYVLVRLLRLDFTNLLGRRTQSVPLPYESVIEDIHAVDFTAALAEAEAAANYRLAVRLGYLQVLRHLAEHHLIDWQPEKTNHHYLQELAGTRWAPDFATLTRQFEYVWYGELPITPEAYPALRESRQQFLHQLSHVAA